MSAEFFSHSAIFNNVNRTASLIRCRDWVREIIMVLIVERRSTMFKNKKLASALLLTTFVVTSVASTALAAGSAEPPQIPGYDRSGKTVPIPNPDRN
jgi:hypothetical protein